LHPADKARQDDDMGEIVNLRSVKKAKAREAAKQAARENRVRHGRTEAEKANDARTAQKARDDSARLDNAAPPPFVVHDP